MTPFNAYSPQQEFAKQDAEKQIADLEKKFKDKEREFLMMKTEYVQMKHIITHDVPLLEGVLHDKDSTSENKLNNLPLMTNHAEQKIAEVFPSYTPTLSQTMKDVAKTKKMLKKNKGESPEKLEEQKQLLHDQVKEFLSYIPSFEEALGVVNKETVVPAEVELRKLRISILKKQREMVANPDERTELDNKISGVQNDLASLEGGADTEDVPHVGSGEFTGDTGVGIGKVRGLRSDTIKTEVEDNPADSAVSGS